MKNIVNWTFGSFFRTIGRIACYLIIGGIIAYFMSDGFSKGNFRLTDLFGIQRVSALSLDGTYNGLTQIRDSGGVINITQSQQSDYVPFTYEYTNNNGHEYIAFPYSGYYGIDQQIDIDSSNFNTFVSKFSLVITLYSRTGYGGYNTQCEMQNNFIVCPMYKDGQYYRLDFVAFGGNLNTQSELNIHLNISAFPIIYDTDTSSIVNAQEQTTNAVNSVNQTITETNSTTDANETYSFFNSYDNQTESQLSQVISAPLTLLNNLIVGTDTKLCFTLKGKQTCIPSGRMIWGKTSRTSIHSGNATFTPHPFSNDGNITNGISAFVVLFNLVVGGFLSYKMMLSLYRMVDDMLNPTNNRIEVLRL